ncbi:hypothetical protein [Nitrospirillum amazonense]|nr:hypothetical protein [Nitrospirillum amazonense]
MDSGKAAVPASVRVAANVLSSSRSGHTMFVLASIRTISKVAKPLSEIKPNPMISGFGA